MSRDTYQSAYRIVALKGVRDGFSVCGVNYQTRTTVRPLQMEHRRNRTRRFAANTAQGTPKLNPQIHTDAHDGNSWDKRRVVLWPRQTSTEYTRVSPTIPGPSSPVCNAASLNAGWSGSGGDPFTVPPASVRETIAR